MLNISSPVSKINITSCSDHSSPATIVFIIANTYFLLIIHLPMYRPTYLTTNLSTIYILSKYLYIFYQPTYLRSIQHLINKQNLWLLHTIVVCCCELLNIKALLLRNKGALTNLQGKPNISKEANKTKLFYSKGLGRNPLSLIKELACPSSPVPKTVVLTKPFKLCCVKNRYSRY